MAFSGVDFIRGLTFGGLLGAGVAGLSYMVFPEFFASKVSLQSLVIFGGCIGTAGQQLIESVVRFAVLPATRTISFYEKMIELAVLRNRNHITQEQYTAILNKMTEQRFLGTTIPDMSQKEPSQSLQPKP
jgi:hypothetical protein